MVIDSHFVEFSKPFIDATKNIFETMISSTLQTQKPSIKLDQTSMGDITAYIGLKGEVEKDGNRNQYEALLVISFPYQTYFKIAEVMLGESYSSYEPEIRDLGSEIVNMVMGNAKKDLTPLGYSSSNQIPTIVEGSGHPIIYPNKNKIITIPFESTHGPFFMELSYFEIKN